MRAYIFLARTSFRHCVRICLWLVTIFCIDRTRPELTPSQSLPEYCLRTCTLHKATGNMQRGRGLFCAVYRKTGYGTCICRTRSCDWMKENYNINLWTTYDEFLQKEIVRLMQIDCVCLYIMHFDISSKLVSIQLSILRLSISI